MDRQKGHMLVRGGSSPDPHVLPTPGVTYLLPTIERSTPNEGQPSTAHGASVLTRG